MNKRRTLHPHFDLYDSGRFEVGGGQALYYEGIVPLGGEGW